MTLAISVHRLEFAVNNRTLFSRSELLINSKEVVALTGKNGSGKSSLLRMLAGIIRPSCGEISIFNKNLYDYTPQQRARLIGYAPQTIVAPPMLSALEYLKICSYPLVDSEVSWRSIERDIEALNATALLHQKIGTLSGGELQRINLISALIASPKIVLLDEPSTALDLDGQNELRLYLSRLKQNEITTLFVTHDLSLIRECAERVLKIDGGSIRSEMNAFRSSVDANPSIRES